MFKLKGKKIQEEEERNWVENLEILVPMGTGVKFQPGRDIDENHGENSKNTPRKCN